MNETRDLEIHWLRTSRIAKTAWLSEKDFRSSFPIVELVIGEHVFDSRMLIERCIRCPFSCTVSQSPYDLVVIVIFISYIIGIQRVLIFNAF